MRTYKILIPALFFFAVPPFLHGSEPYPKGWRILPESNGDDHIRFSITGIQIEDRRITSNGEDYTILAIPGGTETWDPGFPQIPVITESCIIPAGQSAEATIIGMKTVEYPSDKIIPSPPYHDLNRDSTEDASAPIFPSEGEIYSQNTYYPPTEIEFSPTGVIRGMNIGTLRFYPVHYNPVEGKLRIITEIQILIRFHETGPVLIKGNGRIAPNRYFMPLIESLLNPELVQARRPVPEQPSPSLRKAGALNGQINILVSHNGLFRITGSELSASGVNLIGTPLQSFMLKSKDEEVPLLVDEVNVNGLLDESDGLVFYGERPAGEGTYYDAYTNRNVYVLTWDSADGERYLPIPSSIANGPPDSVAGELLHLEEELIYLGGLSDLENHKTTIVESEGFYWDRFIPNRRRSVEFQTPGFDVKSDSVRIRIRFYGVTSTDFSGGKNHALAVKVNGEWLSTADFPGVGAYVHEFSVPAGKFAGNGQSIEIENIMTGAQDAVYFDWIEVEYRKTLTAVNDQLSFSKSTQNATAYLLGGFTDQTIFIVDPGRGIRFTEPTIARIGNSYSVFFGDTTLSGGDRSYAISSTPGLLKPDSLIFYPNLGLSNPGNSADYIIIFNPRLKNSAQLFRDFKISSGRLDGILLCSTDDIYNEFGGGMKSPEAIKSFLDYAYRHWARPPSFVALWGDASWGFDKNYAIRRFDDLVPAYGNPVSDNWYVMMDGENDFLPDLFIGRIPAKSDEEGIIYLDKLKEYAASPPQSWQKNILYINGGFTWVEQGMLLSEAVYLQRQIAGKPPSGMNGTFINRTLIGSRIDYSRREEIIRLIDSGTLWVNSMGHGAALRYDVDFGEPSDLNNAGKYPFMISMSCNTARFADPAQSSLSENYLLIEGKGACGYFGSTGDGIIQLDNSMIEGLFENVFARSDRRIGPAAASGIAAMYAKWGNHSSDLIKQEAKNLALQYSLLGDPAMPLALVDKPELSIDGNGIIPEKDILSSPDSPLHLTVIINNYGTVPQDSFRILMTAESSERTYLISDIKHQPTAYTDTIRVEWDFTGVTGDYALTVSIDPENRVAEYSEENNTAFRPISIAESNTEIVFPRPFERTNRDSLYLRVSLPAVFPRNDAQIYCEIDTVDAFENPLVRIGPVREDPVLTGIHIPIPSRDRAFFIRTRAYNTDTGIFSAWSLSAITHDAANEPAVWYQDSRTFKGGEGRNIQVTDGIELRQAVIPIETTSAGQSDGDYATISINDAPVEVPVPDTLTTGSLFQKGILAAAIRPENGEIIGAGLYDTYASAGRSEELASFISGLPMGTIVAASVKYDGKTNLTPSAIEAFHSIGSIQIDNLAIGSSFACVGKKGASSGTAREALGIPGSGPVSAADSITILLRSGFYDSPVIKGSASWESMTWESTAGENTALTLDIFGRNRTSASWDTLATELKPSPLLDLDFISASDYPELRFRANLESADGINSPKLYSWSAAFRSLPEYIINTRMISVNPDSLYSGEAVHIAAAIYNAGSTGSDTVTCAFSLLDEQYRVLERYDAAKIPPISEGKYDSIMLDLETITGSGLRYILVHVNPERKYTDLSDLNNRGASPIFVAGDTEAPDLGVTFNGLRIADGDYMNQEPEIRIIITDNAEHGIRDTTQIVLSMDKVSIPWGNNPNLRVDFGTAGAGENVQIDYAPLLENGAHMFGIQVRDQGGNTSAYQVSFNVDSKLRVHNVFNYPNPFSNSTQFTYNLTQIADDVSIKIFTVAGRLIKNIQYAPGFTGFNSMPWDGTDEEGDKLANGTYFYKLLVRSGTEVTSVTGKLAIIR